MVTTTPTLCLLGEEEGEEEDIQRVSIDSPPNSSYVRRARPQFDPFLRLSFLVQKLVSWSSLGLTLSETSAEEVAEQRDADEGCRSWRGGAVGSLEAGFSKIIGLPHVDKVLVRPLRKSLEVIPRSGLHSTFRIPAWGFTAA